MLTKPATPPIRSNVDLLRFYRRGVVREHGFEPLAVEGDLPPDLIGTFYRNGPGLMELHGRAIPHLFEADGAVSAVRLDGRGARGAVAVIESEGLRRERETGRVLYGSIAPWWRRVLNNVRGRLKNTANTSLMHHQNRLYALMEAGRPTEIDADTLRTIGESDLDGVLRGAFSAHPHRVASRRATYNFGVQYGRHNALRVYELPDDGPGRQLTSIPLPFAPMLHDFIATESMLIFFLSPVALRVLRLLSGIGGFDDVFAWEPDRGTAVIGVPIDDPDNVIRFKVPAFYQWHFANAFDATKDQSVVDVVRYDNFDSFKGLATGRDFAPGVLERATIDWKAQTLDFEPLADLGCEFPRVNPRLHGARHHHVWIMTEDDRGLARVDIESGAVDETVLEDGMLASEPVFVPRDSNEESAGYALVLCFDPAAKRSCVGIYDADGLANGPRARVWFDELLPSTFHGIWVGAGRRS